MARVSPGNCLGCPLNKAVQLRFGDIGLDWCEGHMPTPDGLIRLRWWKEGRRLAYRLGVPPGYEVKVENLSGRPLVKKL